jgi:ABC-type amino acid transport substrate-binding protein
LPHGETRQRHYQPAQLTGKKVVTVKGGTQEANLRKIVSSVDVVTFETAPQALVALQQHKAAAFINDEVSLFDAYAKTGSAQKDFVILPQNVSTEPIAIGTTHAAARSPQHSQHQARRHEGALQRSAKGRQLRIASQQSD